MTRTDRLQIKLREIAENHKEEIEKLSYRGPRGGRNALYINGWSRSTNNITRANGLPMLNWWDGSAPTSSTGIPECCYDEAIAAEKEIFKRSPWGRQRKK